MIIEGKNSVKEALIGDVTIDKLMVSKAAGDNATNEIISLAREKKILIKFVDKFLLDKLSPTKRHQGVLCFTTEFKYCEIDDILAVSEKKGTKPFILVLDGIEDPHNLGAIIRSAECGAVDGIIIGKHRAVSVNDTVMKVSEGACAHMNIARVTNINDAIKQLKDNFINVYAADMDGESMYDSRLDEAVALVIGSEGFGVKHLTKTLCDKSIAIPMLGKINSLNASNAAAVLIYEAVRQRRK